MSGQIFISYRRDDSSASAGRLYDRLLARLPNNHIFIDVDLEPGIDFVEAIETSVGSCDVLIAVIDPLVGPTCGNCTAAPTAIVAVLSPGIKAKKRA